MTLFALSYFLYSLGAVEEILQFIVSEVLKHLRIPYPLGKILIFDNRKIIFLKKKNWKNEKQSCSLQIYNYYFKKVNNQEVF